MKGLRWKIMFGIRKNNPLIIEEGWKQKTRQRSSRLFGGQHLLIKFLAALSASCFASVYLEETVEFILFSQSKRGKTAYAARNWSLNRSNDLCIVFCFNPSSMPLILVTFFQWNGETCGEIMTSRLGPGEQQPGSNGEKGWRQLFATNWSNSCLL